MKQELAMNGGDPVRTRPFPKWPIITDTMREELLDTFSSGNWSIASGVKTLAFEKAFAKAHGAQYCTAMTNGTHTLLVALLAAGIEAGQEVIVPSWTFFSTAQAVVVANAIPVFADIDPKTLTMDPDHVEKLVTKNTFGMIPVHFAGHPADMDRLMKLARSNNLVCIEDCAQAHDAAYHGKYVGSFGKAGSFSFQISKNMTSGEGGALITNDSKMYENIFSYYNLGRSKSNYIQYVHESIGSNCRMTEFQSALLLHMLTSLKDLTDKRNENALYLNNLLSNIEGIEVFDSSHNIRHGRHIYTFRFKQESFPAANKQLFIKALAAEGIPATIGYPMGVHEQPVFQNMNFGPYTGFMTTNRSLSYREVTLPETTRAVHEVCFLPQNVLLGNRADMEDIYRAVEKVVCSFHNPDT